MAAKSIGVIRDNIQTRLATLPAPLRAYDTFDESVHLPVAVIVYPVSPRSADGFLLGSACAYRYNFVLEVWADTQAGVARAQDTLDAYLSPTGTHANSIEGKLEERTSTDALTTNTTSVQVGAFTSYGFGSLSGRDGLLVATVPVEVFCDNS